MRSWVSDARPTIVVVLAPALLCATDGLITLWGQPAASLSTAAWPGYSLVRIQSSTITKNEGVVVRSAFVPLHRPRMVTVAVTRQLEALDGQPGPVGPQCILQEGRAGLRLADVQVNAWPPGIGDPIVPAGRHPACI